MRRYLFLWTLPLAACVGCEAADPPSDPADALSEPEAPGSDVTDFRALTTAEGDYFDVETFPREATGPTIRSTGHLIVRLDGPAATGPANPPTADDTSGTCGVTFVSPRIAVTAGHCLPGLSEFDEVEVRTPRVTVGFTPNPAIGGTFPNYVHTDAPGHYYDRYICQVRARCYGPTPINCDIEASDISVPLVASFLDIGILDCDAVDGARHDYVNVAPSVAANDGLALPWYHELYAPPTSAPSADDFDAHYTQKGTYATNYHYRGAGVRHQMLPLLSTDYYGSRWKVLGTPTGIVVSTNLRGCHGTSGSGVMRKDAADYPELVGPVTTALGSIAGVPSDPGAKLCHIAGADPDSATGIRTMHPEVTKYFVDQYLASSCANPDSFPNRLAYWLSCDSIFSIDAGALDRWRFRPRDCPWCPSFSRLDHASMEAIRFSAAAPAGLGLQPNDLGYPHRASVRVWTNEFPTTVELRMGGTTVSTYTFTGQTEDWLGNYASKTLTASFVADATTAGPLTIAVTPGSAAQEISVSQVLLVPDGQTAAFDTMHRRISYGLLDAQNLSADTRPMTFTAAEDGGFAATLRPSERMVATGLALTPNRSWRVALSGDAAALNCGLLFADGSETSVGCTTNDAGIVLDGAGADAPVALFVETDANAAPFVSLWDLVVTEVQTCAPAHDVCQAGVALNAACDPCIAGICGADPYCCGVAWDATCIAEVFTVCGQVQCDASVGNCAHSLCTTGAKLTSGCDTPVSPSCSSAVCDGDSYCCGVAWDSICVAEVGSVCGLSCG